jgi:hypothetical protein
MGLGILRAHETRIMDALQVSSEWPPVMALRNENRSEKPRPEECVLPYFGEGRPRSIHFFYHGWVGENDGSWTHLHHGTIYLM